MRRYGSLIKINPSGTNNKTHKIRGVGDKNLLYSLILAKFFVLKKASSSIVLPYVV